MNEYVILHEQGDRMLVYHSKRQHLVWMAHACVLLVHNSHVLELGDP